MSVGVAIMACKERSAYVDDITERLDASPMIVWDERQDRYDTGRRALLTARNRPDISHLLVLQDDALVCRDLVASLEQAVTVVPNNPLCLYFGYGRNGAHQRTNHLAAVAPKPSLVVFEGPWWGVGVVFPVSLIERMLRASDARQASPAYDKRLSRALIRMGIDTYYVLPSLVDHRLDGPSMIEGRDQDGRRAHHFIGQNASALTVDWASLPVLDGHRRNAPQRSLHPMAPAPTPRLPRPSKTTDPTVSVAVMAHPKRVELISSITKALDAPAEVVWDEYNDRWDTGRRAWLACDPNASHALVLQDDCIVSADLVAGLTKALRVVGDNPVGLYAGAVRPATQLMGAMVAHAERTQSSWIVGDGPLWGVGVCVPTHMVKAMLAWCDAHPEIAAYDRRMARYFAQAGIACWYTHPSLVDHRVGVPSLIAGRGVTARKARRFIGAERSGTEIDWTALPHTGPESFVTYQGAGSRRFHQCLGCTFVTTQAHSIRSHVKACPEVRSKQAAGVASVL